MMYDIGLKTTSIDASARARTTATRDILVSKTRRSTPPTQPQQRSNAEQEAHAAAERLNSQTEAALAAMPVRAPESADELENYADRIERTARDLSVALRELARQRRSLADE
jgi:hypothetical protein